jgi:uncharacterized protein
MPEPAFAAATLPLFADGIVDHVEWSVDVGWGPSGVPDWLAGVLDDYAEQGLLDAHGVSFSLLSRHPRQEAWLQQLEVELARRPYRRVSEHLGFMAAGPVLRSSPLPMPHHPDVVARGVEQAARIAEVAGGPIGLENLATSLSVRDALDQGALLADVLAPGDGWMVLDLHNLHCQAATFGLDAVALLDGYPLERVREVHVSGGSWWSPEGSQRQVRRDTHDGPVPDEVLDLLTVVLARCPELDGVVVERIGQSLGRDNEAFRKDYLRVRELCGRPT